MTEDRLEEMARRSHTTDRNRWSQRHSSGEDFQGLFRAAF